MIVTMATCQYAQTVGTFELHIEIGIVCIRLVCLIDIHVIQTWIKHFCVILVVVG